MPVVWSDRHRLHEPGGEIWVGVRTPGTELPARAERIRAALAAAGARVVGARQQPDSALDRVHDASLTGYLAGAWKQWEASGLTSDPGQDRVVPYLFPQPDLFPDGRAAVTATAASARAGQFAYDTMTLIGPGTWEAARAAVDTAVTAAELVLAGAPAAYACCRPPGHHVTRRSFGGSCYLNNSAAAAERLRASVDGRVAVLDIDAHHGNGTQAIFYTDPAVLAGSVHVDPARAGSPTTSASRRRRAPALARAPIGTSRWPPVPATTSGSRRWPASRSGRASAGPARSWWLSGWTPRAATPRARSPSPRPASGPPAARLEHSACPPSPSRKAATSWRPSATSSSRRSSASRRAPVAERSIWVGRDEHEGVRAQPRKDLPPPPQWRLEAVAATERPHSLTLGADRRTALFIRDGETSDVWIAELEQGVPERLTTGRAPAPFWEDGEPRLSPDGATVAYEDGGQIWLVPAAGGPPRRLTEGSGPVWIDAARLLVSVERDHATRLAVVEATDPWPRRLAIRHGALDANGDEDEATVSADGTLVAYTFTPRADLNRSEIRVALIDGGEVRALTGSPRMHDRSPAWSPDGSRVAYASERSGFYELHLVGADGDGDRRLTSAEADHYQAEWHPDGERLVAVRGRRNRFDLVVVDAATGAADVLAEGGTWSSPHWTAAGEVAAAYDSHETAPELRIVGPGGSRTWHAPAPRAVRRVRHAELEDVSFPSFDGLEIPAFLLRPAGASAERPVAAIVHPHGGPTSYYGDEWDGHAQYFVDKGYAWLAINFRGSTGYGREFERANHGVWGVEDTRDCLAATDFLRTIDFVDGERLAIFGASYGSYMALLSVTDDPEHRFRCAVAKYGDCDIVSSWAQGDRLGVQDLERMMGPPAAAREAYRAGSPFHRLENVDVPLLIAHGERDERVSPKQSEQLVAELRRLGKTFEYVTYPTEAHGLLRAGPQLDFYRRLERFLDWHLM